METPFQKDSTVQTEERRNSPVRKVALSLVVIFAGVGVYFILFRSPQSTGQRSTHLPFGPREQAYAPNVHLGNFKMSQAENFINQEVKILEGDVLNVGDREVLAIDATIEFRDSMDQIALRETRPLLPLLQDGLKPGQTAHFSVSFDHVPNSWNYQMPRVAVSGMKFSDNKK